MNILIFGTSILAVNPTDDGDHWAAPDQIIPKHVVVGAQIVNATLPDDYAPGRYTYSGGVFTQVPAAPPPVPQSVPKWAALAALIDAGMDTLPDTYYQSIPAGKQRKLAQAKWQQKPELSIKSPILLAAIAGGIITQSQVDALMIQAAEIARTEAD